MSIISVAETVASVKGWIIGLFVVFLIGLALGGAAGYRWMGAKYYQEKAKNTELARRVEQATGKVVTKVETRVIEKVRRIYVKGNEIVKEVPVYVTKSDDAACELRNGFVRMYDSALLGEPPGPAAETDRAPSGIALSEALEQAIIPNNTDYLACRAKLGEWEAFYAELRAKYGSR